MKVKSIRIFVLLMSIIMSLNLFFLGQVKAFADNSPDQTEIIDFEDSGNGKTITGIKYTYKDSTAVITGYEGTDTCLVIPETINGRTITGLAINAFKDNKVITSVVINAAIGEISNDAFYGCSNLESVVLPDTVEKLGERAFYRCGKLSDINISGKIKDIKTNAFYMCESLGGNLTFTGTQIGGQAFQGTAITGIVLNNVKVTGSYICYQCKKLKNATLNNVDFLTYNYSFQDCSVLENVTIISASAINSYQFDKCKSLKTVVIPKSVTKIYSNAFSNCTNLTYIYIPSSVTSIDNSAFNGDNSLVIYTDKVVGGTSYAKTWADSHNFPCVTLNAGEALMESEISKVSVSHSATLAENFTYNYYYTLGENGKDFGTFDDVWLEVGIRDYYKADTYEYRDENDVGYNVVNKTLLWTEDTKKGYSRYRFSLDSIAAPEIGNIISATLYGTKDGKTYRSFADISSIELYAYDRLQNSSDNDIKPLLVNMLNYCAEAQKYFEYHIGHFVNANLTDEQKRLASTGDIVPDQEESVVPLDGTATGFISSKSITLGNSVELKYYMTFDNSVDLADVSLHMSYMPKIGNEIEVVINGTDFGYDAKNNRYYAKLSTISAADTDAIVSATIYKNGVAISDTLKYGIEIYCKNRFNNSADEDLKNLLQYMLKYTRNAADYFSNSQNV